MPVTAQFNSSSPSDIVEVTDEDVDYGGDIFSDFNEDIDSMNVMEDERFFRYGRFFTFALSVGNTTYTGNRGAAYENEPPSFGVSLSYFQNFRVAYQFGVEYSKHNMVINGGTIGYETAPGLIEVNMIRPLFCGKIFH